jgi:hypothetical protein
MDFLKRPEDAEGDEALAEWVWAVVVVVCIANS